MNQYQKLLSKSLPPLIHDLPYNHTADQLKNPISATQVMLGESINQVYKVIPLNQTRNHTKPRNLAAIHKLINLSTKAADHLSQLIKCNAPAHVIEEALGVSLIIKS